MFVIQFLIGSAIPFVLLGALVVYKHAIGVRTRNRIAFATSMLLLVQVLAMRWNVVIGGQMFSKSFRGFLTFDVDLGGREGLLAAVVLFSLPFLTMLVFSRVLPFWGPVSSAPGRWLEPEPARHVSLRDHSSFTDVGL
jgi:predicted membrane protein